MDSKNSYISPEFKKTAFHCPFCNVYSNQIWTSLNQWINRVNYFQETHASMCNHCHKYSLWFDDKMVYPDFEGVQPPNQDLDEDIQVDYKEAASILQKSPRGAAALLRLSLQKLCKQLGEKGKDMNDDIASLVKKGLPPKVKESLDSLRVIGNESVHPGELDLRDDPETAQALFRLVNFIAEKMISEHKEIEDIYNKIPESKKEQIKQRDGEIN